MAHAENGKQGAGEKKALIEYPVSYTFKVMGLQEGDFREYVRALFKQLMGMEPAPGSVSEQPSSRGKYLSITVTVDLVSEDQRRGIYERLHQEKRILYYL